MVMKKTYIIPAFREVSYDSDFCDMNLVIGSGNRDESSGDGTDLVKEEKNVWDDVWNRVPVFDANKNNN